MPKKERTRFIPFFGGGRALERMLDDFRWECAMEEVEEQMRNKDNYSIAKPEEVYKKEEKYKTG